MSRDLSLTIRHVLGRYSDWQSVFSWKLKAKQRWRLKVEVWVSSKFWVNMGSFLSRWDLYKISMAPLRPCLESRQVLIFMHFIYSMDVATQWKCWSLKKCRNTIWILKFYLKVLSLCYCCDLFARAAFSREFLLVLMYLFAVDPFHVTQK